MVKFEKDHYRQSAVSPSCLFSSLFGGLYHQKPARAFLRQGTEKMAKDLLVFLLIINNFFFFLSWRSRISGYIYMKLVMSNSSIY